MLAPKMGGKSYEPQFIRTRYFPVLKPSIINFHSAARALDAVKKNMAVEGYSGMVCRIYNDKP